MGYKYIGFKKKNDRYLITLEKSTLFGLIKTTEHYIDSNSHYTYANSFTCFYNYPEMTVLGYSEEPLELLNGYLRKILFDETNKIHNLGKNRHK